jgi:hypothetical protein
VAAEALAVHRVSLEYLLGLAAAEVSALWDVLVGRAASEVGDILAVALPGLLGFHGPAAATLGADWYDDMRDIADVPGAYRAEPISLPNQGRLDAFLGVTTQPLFPKDPDVAPDFDATKALLDQAFERLVADMDRDTVRGSLIRDPQGMGWARQLNPGACDFCTMLAGRGAVYSARTAVFASHDGCGCIAVPRFGDPKTAGVQVHPYVPSPRLKTQEQRDKNNRRLREYLTGQQSTTRRRTGRTPQPAEPVDVDAGRSTAQLQATLDALEASLAKFDSPGTRARAEDLRRKIAARS